MPLYWHAAVLSLLEIQRSFVGESKICACHACCNTHACTVMYNKYVHIPEAQQHV